MCRILACATSAPTTLEQVLGESNLAAFAALSSLHADGWGSAVAQGAHIETQSEPTSAKSSTRFAQMAHAEAADVHLVHLRWATPGLEVSDVNTHPFTHGDIAFVHNGSITPPSAAESLISPEFLSEIKGQTDSERFFYAILTSLEGREPTVENLIDAFSRTLTTITSSLTYSSLNSVLLTPEYFIVGCCFDETGEGAMPEPDYFHLRYRIEPGSVVVASTGWGADWQTLPNRHLLVVDRGTLATRIQPLAVSTSTA
ncbi:MAG: class II glutamine amidotransferase [Actinomycetes bacterium]